MTPGKGRDQGEDDINTTARMRLAMPSPPSVDIHVYTSQGAGSDNRPLSFSLGAHQARDLLMDLGRTLADMAGLNKHNPHELPIGTEYRLGKRCWRLVAQQPEQPDWQTWQEVTDGEKADGHTPDRIMNASEVAALINAGIPFVIPDDNPPARKLAREANAHR